MGAPGTHVGLVRKYFKNKTGDIDKVTLVEPRRIKTLTKAPTSYLEMKTKDLELGQVKFNYFDYFQSLNQEYTDYYLKSSEVFIVKNIENYKFTLGDFLKDSEKELPYNISRKLENNEIVTSSPYFDRGVRKFPLSWVDEFRDNKFFTDLNRCVDFSFYSSEHLNSFEQSLKEIQIANLETYSSEYGSTKPRTYNSINQWVNRTNHEKELKLLNMLKIIYNTKVPNVLVNTQMIVQKNYKQSYLNLTLTNLVQKPVEKHS